MHSEGQDKEPDKYGVNLIFKGSRDSLEWLLKRSDLYLATEGPHNGVCRYGPKGKDTSLVKVTPLGDGFSIEGSVTQGIYLKLIEELKATKQRE